jgi:hypothetical protein
MTGCFHYFTIMSALGRGVTFQNQVNELWRIFSNHFKYRGLNKNISLCQIQKRSVKNPVYYKRVMPASMKSNLPIILVEAPHFLEHHPHTWYYQCWVSSGIVFVAWAYSSQQS